MRLAPIGQLAPTLLDFSTSSDVQEWARGTVIDAVGTDYNTGSGTANWGQARLMYVSNVSSAILPGFICVYDRLFHIFATQAAATVANTGEQAFVTVTNFAVGSTTEQFGWILISGITPVKYSVAATTGSVYAGTAGTATPTAAAGAQLLGVDCKIAAVTTFTRSGSTKTGSSKVVFGNVGGMYPGQAISGTGIPASSVISSLDTDGRTVNIGSAVGTLVTATAAGTVTCTMTNTGYGICLWNNAIIQGQIT